YKYQTIYHYIVGTFEDIDSVVCVASTGIAATLLPNASTYHSRFGLPVPFLDNSTSNIKGNSIAFKLLRKCKAIFWDEITNTPYYALDEVDRLLREICNTNLPFGGKVFIVGGDFRQTLPVIKRGTRASIVESCVKSSALWYKFQRISLVENMRVQNTEDASFRL